MNRVLAGKEGVLVLDYIGIAVELKNTMKTYTLALVGYRRDESRGS